MVSTSAKAAFAHRLHTMRSGYLTLLVAQVVLIAGSPALVELNINRGQYGLLGFLVFTAALYAVMGQRRITLWAFLLGGASMACNVSASFAGMKVASVPGLAFGALFMGFTTAVLLRSILMSEKVTMDTLYGAVAAYIMLGLTWGAVYFLVEAVAPLSFRSSLTPGMSVSWPDCMFFSFITLTTIGYGDVIPVGNMAKSLVTLEAVTGVMYPAILIGRLLTMHGAEARRR